MRHAVDISVVADPEGGYGPRRLTKTSIARSTRSTDGGCTGCCRTDTEAAPKVFHRQTLPYVVCIISRFEGVLRDGCVVGDVIGMLRAGNGIGRIRFCTELVDC